MPRPTAARQGPTAAILATAVLLALAVFAASPPARGSETATGPATDRTITITAFPPAILVDSAVTDDSGDVPSKPKRGARILIGGDDEDFDVFSGQVRKNPWIIGLIFLVVGSIFLTPVILLVGIIWYKLRKTRLQNEAMLRLAERGVVPASQAADALATGASPAAVAPQMYQQAIALRRRVAWSDLRKGVILAAIGIAFQAYEANTGGGASWIGLILLFLGIGYTLLWWMEGRHLDKAAAAAPAGVATPGAGGAGSGGSPGTGVG